MGWHKNRTEAKREHNLERCNHKTFAAEVESWRGFATPQPHPGSPAAATNAGANDVAAGAGDAAALQPGKWASLGRKAHVAARAAVFKGHTFKTRAAATEHAGKMCAGAIPEHAVGGKCVHNAHQIALTIKTAKVPGCDKLHHQVCQSVWVDAMRQSLCRLTE